MGACGSSHDRYSPADDSSSNSADKPPRKTMTPEELRSSRARDSMRFNNRKKKAPTALEEGDEGSPVRHKVTRDSMVFNNRSQANKALELTLVPAEDFICGCRDVLRSPVLLDKIRELVEGGSAPYSGIDLLCVSMIPRDKMFKFYSQESLRHSLFATCNGPSSVHGEQADEEFEKWLVPSESILELLRNMFFLKRMQLCFDEEDFSPKGVTKDAFRLACTQPESLYANGDGGALFDRTAADRGETDRIDWRHLVVAIADNFINRVALPSVE